MPSPTKENRALGSARKRGALGGADGSPARKQQKKKAARKDRRRVSFAPDPELTMVHHFLKDEDYTSNSGDGRVVVAYDEPQEPTVTAQPAAQQQQHQQQQQHPALAGAGTSGGYRPGFWNKTVPENSPLSMSVGGLPPMDSPGSVSMELTQPTVGLPQQQAAQQHQPGEVTAGLPSLGALAEADELEGAAEEQQAQQPVPGEVTAALPSLGALADADEWEQGEAVADADGWAAAGHGSGNVTTNITAALPGLGALVAEDEDATAGMDLTVPAGRVLEHRPQQVQYSLSPAAVAAPSPAAAGPSPAGLAAATLAAAAAVSPAPAIIPSPGQQQLVEQQQQEAHPALAAAEEPAGAAELEPTVAVPTTGGRVSGGGTDELEAVQARQLNKWGFAPGQEDTLDINLEMHGRMIMGDQTFNRMYCDNTTGDSRFARSPDTTGNSVLLQDVEDEAAAAEVAAAEQPGGAFDAAAAAGAGAAPLPAQHHTAPSPVAAPAGPFGAPAAAPGPFGAAPNWTAPAFLPPYLQQGPAASGAQSDHPALAHSPDVTNSSLNTLETRRISVDARRMSINSRRFSMQDATGRLLADDGDLSLGSPGHGLHHTGGHHHPSLAAVAEAPGSAQQGMSPLGDGPASGTRSRRRSSGAKFLGRDMTDKLLVDEDSLAQEDVGPLADLKRQMRMLSQGSPVVAPGPEQAAALAAAAEEAAAEAAAEASAEAAGGEAALPPAKTPRAALSMGYADSHNPATVRLLRSGGTTRLLAETGSLDEDDLLLTQQGAAGGGGGSVGRARRGSGAHNGDNAATARTTGTTKLLADITMASMVGAKLLGRQGTPELAQHGGADNGLTGFSLDLDEFERPPELQAGEPVQQEQQLAQQEQQEEGMQLGDDEEAAAAQEQQAWQAAEAEAQAMQLDGFASPALQPAGGEFGTGYPLDEVVPGSAGAIPGGPKLHRTPVPARSASQPRSVQGTPHSNAHSLRSQPRSAAMAAALQHATPATHGTHGMHRLARTPGSVRPAAVAYPIDADVTADNQIPGGPKLARTPMGRTPATGGFLPVPGSAVAQHYPGSAARGVHFAALPGSASLPRYPGSAAAAHRLGGLTPQHVPPPMTFQDFCKVAEVQFLDNLRRGASINYADLQPNPVPANLGEAYRLLSVIAPQVSMLENGIRILQEEVQARRVSAAEAEATVGQLNPAAFQRAAAADDEELDVLREHVGLLKKVCRQKALYCLKDVRIQMEESRGTKLQRHLEALQGDLELASGWNQQMEEVASAAQQFVADAHRRIAQEAAAREEEAARCIAVAGMRSAIAEQTAANKERRARLAEVQERVAKLREEHAAVHKEREALRGRTDALQMTLMQSQGQEGGLGRDYTPDAILKKLEDLDTLKSCLGWQLESAAEDVVSSKVVLRLADLFRVRLDIGGRVEASATVEVLPEAECKVPAGCRAMLAALAGCPDGGAAPAPELRITEPTGPKVAALVQAVTARLSRLADLAAELDGLRLAFPALTDVACSADGSVALSFINLDAEVKFGATLRLPASYPLGPVQAEPRIWFDGEGQVSEQRIAAAVAAAPEAPGRLRAICRQLSLLAREALPRPAVVAQGDGTFHAGWTNPLFGSAPTVSAQS